METRRYLEIVSKMGQVHQKRPGYAYTNFEEYVLTEGQSFTPRVLTRAERRFVEHARDRIFVVPQHCFENAREIVLKDKTKTLQYAEGFATPNKLIPLLHAWGVYNDTVYDPTWGLLFKKKELLLAEYYGVIINRQVLKRAKPSSGMSLIDNWTDGYPLLKKAGAKDA